MTGFFRFVDEYLVYSVCFATKTDTVLFYFIMLKPAVFIAIAKRRLFEDI